MPDLTIVTTRTGYPVCSFGSSVVRINASTLLVNGVIVEFPDLVRLTIVSDSDVKEDEGEQCNTSSKS